MSIAIFSHDGGLPAQFQDFYSESAEYPNITLVTQKTSSPEEEDEGWLFIIIDVKEIDEDIARKAIAEAITLKPEEIELREFD